MTFIKWSSDIFPFSCKSTTFLICTQASERNIPLAKNGHLISNKPHSPFSIFFPSGEAAINVKKIKGLLTTKPQSWMYAFSTETLS